MSWVFTSFKAQRTIIKANTNNVKIKVKVQAEARVGWEITLKKGKIEHLLNSIKSLIFDIEFFLSLEGVCIGGWING